ncbi:Cell morphogenesis protein PAG1, partial [Coemansia biformis]
MHEKASPTTLRTDLIGAFGSLFLFAVVSLPASDLTLRVGLGSALGESLAGVRSPKGGAGSSNGGAHSSIFGGGHGGGGGGASSSAGGGGSSSRSRLAKTIARKLAPLKSTSRNSKQEQGIGLASIAQLVRVASVILRSDNAPLRQQTALALAHTPSMYLHELLQELRPLADFLFDDGTSGLSHRNYLHVSGATGSATGGAGLMASLGHGSGSPGSGVLAALGSSPKPTPQQAQRTATGGTSTTQLAPHPSSKRRTGMAGGGSRTRESSGLGSDTEATSDSGNHGDKGGDSRSKSSTGSAASQVRGRRANSFDAAAVGSSMGTSHGDAGALGSGGAGLMVSSASNVAAAAAAVAAAVNAGASSSTAFQTRRRRLRLSLAQIYTHVSRQLDALDQNGHALYMDGQIMAQLIAYVRETKTFLSESSAQWEWEHQPLRIHFCGLVEGLYYFMSSAAMADLQAEPHPTAGKRQQQQQQPSRGAGKTSAMFTHETRSGLYQLFERWCGLGRYSESSRDAQERMIAMAVDQLKDAGEKEHLAASLEDERQQLELVSLRAMAVLCRSGSTPHASTEAPPNASDSSGGG